MERKSSCCSGSRYTCVPAAKKEPVVTPKKEEVVKPKVDVKVENQAAPVVRPEVKETVAVKQEPVKVNFSLPGGGESPSG